MDTTTSGIQTGMDVLDATGEKIGRVADILAVSAVSQTGSTADPYAGTTAGGFDTGGTFGTGVAGQRAYLKVEQGGILGIGSTDLYVPFDDVRNIVPGESVTINCAKDQCASTYGTKPDFLS